MPAIATEDATVPLMRNRLYQRQPGDVLHPKREPLDELMRLKRSIGSVNFFAQFQQDPVPSEGNMIRTEWLKTYDLKPTRIAGGGGQIVQSWNTAAQEGLVNDWSVCITALIRKQQVFIPDVWRRKVAFPDQEKAAISLAWEHHADGDDRRSGQRHAAAAGAA